MKSSSDITESNVKFEIIRKRIPLRAQIIFSITILFSVILASFFVKITYSAPYLDVDVVTANNMITNGSYPNLIILDVRTQNEYNEGHIENSTLIPVSELEARIDELAQFKNTEILVYCHTGARSVQAANILEFYNFTKIFNVLGGITAWESASYPIIPEFSSWFPTFVILVIATISLALYKRKLKQ